MNVDDTDYVADRYFANPVFMDLQGNADVLCRGRLQGFPDR